MSGPTFNQNHSGSGHNIINIGPRRPEMTDDVMRTILDAVRGQGFDSVQVQGNSTDESFKAADRLADYLRAAGLVVTRDASADTYFRAPGPTKPYMVYTDQTPPLLLVDLTVRV